MFARSIVPPVRRTSASSTGTRRRRVLLVTNRYRTYHRRVIETLVDAFDFGIVWLSPPYAHDPVPPDLGARLQSWTLGEDPRRLTYRDPHRSARLFKLIATEGRHADLVIAPAPAAWKGKLIYAAARVARVPVAFRFDVWREGDGLVRSTPSRPPSGPRAMVSQAVDRFVEKHGDALLVPGSASREFIAARGIERDRIVEFHRLIPEISRLPLDPELVGRLKAIKGSRVAFLYLGRVMHQKGLVPLIRAFRALLSANRDAVLFVVGGPIEKDIGAGKPSVEYYEEAKMLAESEPRIVFAGNVDPTTVHNYYEACDVFVHPHVANVDGQEVFEPWGNVISEAACMRLAIIASDRIPAAFDLVENNVNGFLLDARRIEEQLVPAMARFVDHPDVLDGFAAASRRKYDAFADPAALVAGLNQIIDRARGTS